MSTAGYTRARVVTRRALSMMRADITRYVVVNTIRSRHLRFTFHCFCYADAAATSYALTLQHARRYATIRC